MPIARFQMDDGRIARFEVPEGTTPEQAQSMIAASIASSNRPTDNAPPMSSIDRFTKGLRDPIDAGAQILGNITPKPIANAIDTANNWIADKTGLVSRLPAGGVDQMVRDAEKTYQDNRKSSGDTGIDGMRMLGNIASPANLAIASRVPAAVTLAGRVGIGAGFGGVSGALTPVADGDFATEKAKQIASGAAVGGVLPAIGNAISRVVNPANLSNVKLQMLKNEGVSPTIGQTLGGWANRLEEAAQSVPILGDAIMAARSRAKDQFNNAAINRASSKVGESVDNIGANGVRDAGDAISHYYNQALGKVSGVPLDSQFSTSLSQLQGMANSLTPDMARKFKTVLNDMVLSRVSPNGSILGQTYKTIDSDLGNIASRYGKSTQASEQELGDAVSQLKNLLNQQMRRTNPEVDAMLNKADEAWANLVRVEGAAKAAKNAEGVFTPAQLNTAVQVADDSVRKRAVSRGTALMQDLADAGQSVLGNKYPDSGTARRLMLGGAGLGAGLLNPAIPAALLGGAGLYTSPAQKALNALVGSRPEFAGLLSDRIQKGMPYLLPASGQVSAGLLNSP